MERGQMEIRVTYTGIEPNLKPAASAFARAIKSKITAAGTFADPELEAEYQEWKAKKKAC